MEIRTLEEVEREAHQQVARWQRRLELMDAYHNHLITERELDDALLLLSLRAPSPDPPPEIGRGELEKLKGG